MSGSRAPETARNRSAAPARATASPAASRSASGRSRARSAKTPAAVLRPPPPYSAVPAQVRKPVQCALQDEDRGVLVDHLGAAGAADIHPDQLALDGGCREPLIPQRDRQMSEFGKIARKCPGRLRPRP